MSAAPSRLAALCLGLLVLAPPSVARSGATLVPAPKPGCEFKDIDAARYGERDYKAPDEVRPVGKILKYTLRIAYSDQEIAGCATHMRTYNGKLVGDTMRVKPGDSLHITLVNDIAPAGGHGGHAGSGHDMNVTNLHTHGLHVSPKDNSDNVFLEVKPGETQEYVIDIPKDHPAGTFWYHAHMHGSTAVQVSSGMAGAIIVEGGLDKVKGIDGIAEKVMVLQQLSYDEQGVVEDFAATFGPGKWPASKRRVTINGQLVPVIRMRPGEIQRWRFIHGGVRENIALTLQGSRMNEIAADGLSFGRSVAWTPSQPLILSPGYRSDVLVQARPLRGAKRLEYYLVDGKLLATNTLQGELRAALSAAAPVDSPRLAPAPQNRRRLAALLASLPPKPEAVLAKIIVEGDPVEMAMPTAMALAPTLPFPDILPRELTDVPQTVDFNVARRTCDANGHCVTPCTAGQPGCAFRFLVNDYTYGPGAPTRNLALGKAGDWTLSSAAAAHPFHIHVNPFQIDRMEPGGRTRRIWKDTLLVDHDDGALKIWMRYEDFPGDMVLHCHILDHEDEGMMQRVSIN